MLAAERAGWQREVSSLRAAAAAKEAQLCQLLMTAEAQVRNTSFQRDHLHSLALLRRMRISHFDRDASDYHATSSCCRASMR